jgi:arylsulfatase A-like enzyme
VPLNQLEQDTENFELDPLLRRIYFTRGKQRRLLENIPSITGSYFYLSGKKQIVMTPTITGEVNLYTYLDVHALDKETSIDFKLILHSKKKNNKVLHLAVKKTSRPIYQSIRVKRGDKVLMRFSGRGIVYFSQPVFYKPHNPAANINGKHIFFVGVDTFRGDLIGKKVNGKPLTPHMNRFMTDSVYMEHTYTQTSWTLGSFMSVFTGLNEYHHEVGIKQSLLPEKPFLVEPLREEYLTFGYHGGKVMNSRFGFSRGFDYYKKFQPAGALYPKGGRHLFNKAIELLTTAKFPNLFLFLHTYQVHAPYTPPKEFLLKRNPNATHDKLDLINFSEPEKTFEPLSSELTEATAQLYEAEAMAFDAYFGQFITRLKKMGLYENAMIILMSDHGEEFFDHKGWGHSHSLYNELIQVPLFIKFPAGEYKNIHIKSAVALTDIMPTLLSLQGLKYPAESLDGRNLMPLIQARAKGQKNIHREEAVVSTISTGRYFAALPTRIALIVNGYKLLYHAPYSSRQLAFFDGFTAPPAVERLQLFDLTHDPGETRNVIEKFPLIKAKLFPLMQKIQKTIQKKSAQLSKRKIDKEVKEHLKSLGYL